MNNSQIFPGEQKDKLISASSVLLQHPSELTKTKKKLKNSNHESTGFKIVLFQAVGMMQEETAVTLLSFSGDQMT